MRIEYGKCMKCREITFITLAEDEGPDLLMIDICTNCSIISNKQFEDDLDRMVE